MEDGLFNTCVANTLDIGGGIVQWISILDRTWNELRNYFPSRTAANAGAVSLQSTDTNEKTWAVTKPLLKQGTHIIPNQITMSTTTGPLSNQATLHTPTVERDTGSCGFKMHHDANQNSVILWCEFVLKGTEASGHKKSFRYFKELTNLRKTLPLPKPSSKYAPDDSVVLHSIDTNIFSQ